MAEYISTTLQRAPSSAAEIARPGLTLKVERTIGIAKLQLLGRELEQRFAQISGVTAPATGAQVEESGLTVAWLAPGEWLLVGAELLVAACLLAIEERSCGEAFAADITHARTSFLLSGANARGALAAHCPLDFWPSAFPVNAAARTLLGDTGMFIARLEDAVESPRFRIIVDQTMGSYAARMIAGPLPRSGARP